MRLLFTLLLIGFALLSPPAFGDVRPEEMVTSTVGKLEFHYPERFEPAAAKLKAIAAHSVLRAEDSLGLDDLGKVEVWIVPEVSDYFEVTGTPGNPPKWAVGLSLTDRGVIVVVNGTGQGGGLVELDKTFEHELAHVAIDRARQGHHVPRWFNEGYALLHADEWNPERADVFGRAASAGSLKSFSDIERNFPEHSASAGLAYAQSLQFLMYVERVAGRDVIVRIMDGVRAGKPFDEAFKSAVGKSLALTEATWRQQAESQMSGWSILNDGTWGLFGAAILFIVTWLVVRRRRKVRFSAMREEEGEWDYDESRYPMPGARRE